MKVIAFYLPQFHSFPENDEWWGKGFTEWMNTRKAKPLFKNHYQPHIPLAENYYDLSSVDPMIEQAKIARKYGVDAFCFYHYWFMDGKQLMEKPVERFLEHPEIDIEFCLSWANEPWTRAWDGEKNSKHILMPQEYGGENEWRKHFEYLLPFFKDHRYIIIDNSPLVLIYRPDEIPDFWRMAAVWEELARKEGYNGVKFAVQGCGATAYFPYDKSKFDYIIEFEPVYTQSILRKKTIIYHPTYLWSGFRALVRNERVRKAKKRSVEKNIQESEPIYRYDYDEICHSIVKRKPYTKTLVPGMAPSWDNTPRRGMDGVIYHGSTPAKFQKYMEKQLVRAKKVYHQEMLFINAWNEWAEGAHLEPDEKYGYGYLEALKSAREKTGV